MNYFRAFVAGTVFPTLILPLILCFATYMGRAQVLQVSFIHWLPIIWGIWNALYFYIGKSYLPKDQTMSLLITGAVLGLLVALYGIFWLDIPSILGLSAYKYFPLIAAPVLYAIVWRYIVKPLNEILVK